MQHKSLNAFNLYHGRIAGSGSLITPTHFHQTSLSSFKLSSPFIMQTFPNFPAQFPKLSPSCPQIGLQSSCFLSQLCVLFICLSCTYIFSLSFFSVSVFQAQLPREAWVSTPFFLEALMPAPVL